jgi:hypothetical protein
VEGQQINKHNGQEEYHPALFLSIKVKRKAHSPFLFHPRFAFASSFTQLCYPPPVIHHTGHNVIGEKRGNCFKSDPFPNGFNHTYCPFFVSSLTKSECCSRWSIFEGERNTQANGVSFFNSHYSPSSNP